MSGSSRADDSARLSHVEQEVAGLKTDVAHIRHSQDNIEDALRDISKRIAENNRPQWATYAAWASVLIVMAAAFGSGYVDDLKDVEGEVDVVEARFRQHEQLGGHRPMQQRIGALEDEVVKLDTVLQREMRLLDDTMSVRIEQMDETLQREMRLLDEIQNARGCGG